MPTNSMEETLHGTPAAGTEQPIRASSHPELPHPLCTKYTAGQVVDITQGGHCIIMKAVTNDEQRTPACIKFVRAAKNPAVEQVVRRKQDILRREAECLMACAHPNILEVFELVDTPDCVAMVTELMTTDLFNALNMIPEGFVLPAPWVTHVAREICSAVAYMHSKNICHLDIKPENTLIRQPAGRHPSGRPWQISDFFDPAHVHRWRITLSDPAFWNHSRNEANEIVLLSGIGGSEGYMSPEMVQHKAFDGEKADVWSLARTLFCVAAGFPPWEACDSSDVFYHAWASGCQAEYWTAVRDHHCTQFKMTEEFCDMLTQMMSVDPNGRSRMVTVTSHPFFRATTKVPLAKCAPNRVSQAKSGTADELAVLRRRDAAHNNACAVNVQ